MTPRGFDRAKRLADVAVSAAALAITLPLQGMIAVVVRRQLGTPVLFRQRRPGRDGRPFTLVKFRTMRPASTGTTEDPTSDAERMTPLGKILRSTSLDELPTLWNVLRGDMSLVGPRPLLVEYLSLYSSEQGRRHEVRPGITGLAQVNGRNTLAWPERLALDVEYVDRRSVALDLRILLKTIAPVVGRSGVTAPGEATMTKFAGSTVP